MENSVYRTDLNDLNGFFLLFYAELNGQITVNQLVCFFWDQLILNQLFISLFLWQIMILIFLNLNLPDRQSFESNKFGNKTKR